MPTELDLRMDKGIAAVVAEGSPLALTKLPTRFGVELPMFSGVPPHLAAYFAANVEPHRAATFLVAGEERLTMGEVYEHAQAVAGALVADWGIKKGDRVGLAMRNAPAWIVSYMGILMAGGVATLLNGWWQGGELVDAIRETEVSLVIADGPRAARIAEGGTHDARVVVLDEAQPIASAIAPLLAKGGAGALPELSGDDVATILFTSGSTGQSKGAYSTHRAVVQAIYNYLAQALVMLGIATEDGAASGTQPSTLLTVPLFHVTAEVPVFLQSFAMGRKLVVMRKWDAEEAMRLIQQEQVSYFVGVPLMSYEILTHARRHEYDLSTVTDFAGGGAPRPVDHVKRIDKEMGGGAPLIGYGLTETNGVGCGNWRTNYLAKPNSTGRASPPLVDLAILNDAGKPVPTGERGEVCIRSVCNFEGYWNRPEATADAFTADGYFRTGDIGYLDSDGYLFIVDRKKDIIIRGGENISCQEVEAALYEHPQVAETAVFGLADERFGEVPAAVVHPRDGAALDAETLQAFLKERIAAFKIPGRIWIAPDALPRLGTEKIDKVGIKKRYRAEAEAG